MTALINIEIYKIFKKWRTYISFIAIGVLIPIIHIAMMIEGEHSLDYMTRNLKQSFIFVGNLLNGYLISYLILNSLVVHIPFLITLVAGDLLAGEATAGTYRILITRPVSRFKITSSKFLAGIFYTCLLVLFLAIMSLGLGILIFGQGELIVIKSSGIIIFARGDIFWRFLTAYAFASLSMSVVAGLAFLFSSLVENAIGPIVATMAIIIIFIIISAIDVSFFQAIKPYLFTTYMNSWRLLFDNPLNINEILSSVLILLGHVAAFFFAAAYIFNKKDILS
ncbi:MAG TPA: ABC transporter permease subunit [Ignavibacteriaceae bacterium]|nr:ABC transporter permease subunit [Ignavibacteriaceae bacterium]